MKLYRRRLVQSFVVVFSSLVITNCGSSSTTTIVSDNNEDGYYQTSYKGLKLYYKSLNPQDYKLTQLNDEDFNSLSKADKLLVANKLLNSFFFGYPLPKLKEKINSGHFISDIRNGLTQEKTDIDKLESYILDDDYFRQYTYGEPQAITILTRFYAMEYLDKYYLQNWIAYTLTQTIMFSPAYELSSTHPSNISGVYNRIVTMLKQDSGMRFVSYVHMISEDNWRRFRSPEDNGREMLEIFLFDTNDTHVPIAAKALQNWKLNSDSDTLEIGLNQNQTPLKLFDTTIYTGDDFYVELVKYDGFTKGVTKRLVEFFFPEVTSQKEQQIIDTIVSSHPERWQDILLQIVFSKEYLLHNHRTQSAEETFFSLAKKLYFKHHLTTIASFKYYLEKMNQATMKYKLGRLDRVPQDSFSFAYYSHYIRREILLRHSSAKVQDNYSSWSRQGWGDELISFDNFDYDTSDKVYSLHSFINYLFNTVIARDIRDNEFDMFKKHMIVEDDDGNEEFVSEFDMFIQKDDEEATKEARDNKKQNIVRVVFEYLSRIDMTYRQMEVK